MLVTEKCLEKRFELLVFIPSEHYKVKQSAEKVKTL